MYLNIKTKIEIRKMFVPEKFLEQKLQLNTLGALSLQEKNICKGILCCHKLQIVAIKTYCNEKNLLQIVAIKFETKMG